MHNKNCKNINWHCTKNLKNIPISIDTFLANSTHGSLFQSPFWNLRTSTNPNNYFVLVAFINDVPVFGATIYKSRIPGTKYFSAILDKGPVFDKIDIAISIWRDFENIIAKKGAINISVSPYWNRHKAQNLNTFLLDEGYTFPENINSHTETVTIDLSADVQDIFTKSLTSSKRNMIRKGYKKGINVRPISCLSEMRTFWELYNDMCQNKNIFAIPLKQFEKICQYSKSQPTKCSCLVGWIEREMIGGCIVLRHGERAEVYRGGASQKEMKGIPKTEIVLWESILWAKQKGATIFDLGGYSPDAEEGSALWNINRFKLGFSKKKELLFLPMQKTLNHLLFEFHKVLKNTKNRMKAF